jgi:hypothetical protein
VYSAYPLYLQNVDCKSFQNPKINGITPPDFCQNIELARHQKKEFTDHEKHSNAKMNRSGQIPLRLKKEGPQPQ